ncbi:Os03g0197600 [Oryza sativa Japonica Group]|uniref:Os03g0197600 protein n=1 Tax=Oryza sativa subsp. japonica TaxID=39947 RepID=A0A0P0VU77_ORYSJ|nr:Os03g0197600 [Oryza sativa Japonica Group]
MSLPPRGRGRAERKKRKSQEWRGRGEGSRGAQLRGAAGAASSASLRPPPAAAAPLSLRPPPAAAPFRLASSRRWQVQKNIQMAIPWSLVFLFKHANSREFQLSPGGNKDKGAIAEQRVSLLRSWLPLLCRGSNGTNAPVLSSMERTLLHPPPAAALLCSVAALPVTPSTPPLAVLS